MRWAPAAVPLLLWMAPPVSELRVQAGRQRLRPYETAIIEAQAGSRVAWRVRNPDGGWISKPFRMAGAGEAVLYTAPQAAGTYTVEALIDGGPARAVLEVNHAAPSYRAGETTSFPPEKESRDFYQSLAEQYAPFVCQETWFDPKADFLARFDYDGDWRGDNNWDNLAEGSSQAYVYYAAMETATHYFLVYNFFYPRRYSDSCAPEACHENDSQGLILTIRKDGSRYGRLQTMETLAEESIYSYTLDSRIREGAQTVDGEIRLWTQSHPIVFVESGTHRVFSAGDTQRARFSADRLEFTGSTGVTYRYGGRAARPLHGNDREVSYELLRAAEQLWPRAISRDVNDSRSFDEYFRYAPFGNRPPASAEEIAGAFLGRKHGTNRARPFWAWRDAQSLRRRLLAVGQWALDPAYGASVDLRFPTPFSLDYIHNPYLLAGSGRGYVTTLPTSPNTPQPQASTGGERHRLAPPADKPNYKLRDRHGELEFRGRVDGSLYLHIRGDQIEVEYLGGRPMDEIRYRFSQPLPAAEMEEVKLDNIEGRGSVRLLEWPNLGNQFTAKIRIQDEKGGAGQYKFKLLWRR